MDLAFLEHFVSKVLSNDSSQILEATKSLDELQIRLKEEPVRFSRVVQEIAIYRQASVIKELGNHLFQEQDNLEALHDALIRSFQEKFHDGEPGQILPPIIVPDAMDPHKQAASILVLSRLATSKVVAQAFLSGERVVERMMHIFSRKIERLGTFTLSSTEMMHMFQGIANFAYASKVFRQGLQASGIDFLPAVRALMSEDDSLANEAEICASVEAVAKLIETLSLSPDSRLWMIDAGYLHILAELYETKRQGSFVIRCAFALLRLLDSRECLTKMREMDVLSLLRPLSEVLKARVPPIWSQIENELSNDGDGKKNSRDTFPWPLWKALRKLESVTFTVCSWKDCSAFESHVVAAFSKCGRCGVAPYCR